MGGDEWMGGDELMGGGWMDEWMDEWTMMTRLSRHDDEAYFSSIATWYT